LIEVPAVMNETNIPKEITELLGINETLVRISVGLDEAEDLLADLDHGLYIA